MNGATAIAARSAWILALLLLGCRRGASARPGVPPRHLVLLTVAGLRADHVGALGQRAPTTGNPLGAARAGFDLDELAASGVAFACAFAPAPEPALAAQALFYGRSSGVLAASVDPRCGAMPHPSLSELLRARGMRTAAYVSGPGMEAMADGFDTFVAAADDTDAVLRAWEGFCARDAAERDEPLFLWLHLAQPAPPIAPAALRSDIAALDYAAWFAAVDESAAAGYKAEVAQSNELLRFFLERYAHGTVDEQGEWVLAAERQPRFEQTLFVVAGLGGTLLGEECGVFGADTALRDATLRVPLVLTHPASLTGRRIFDAVVALEDLAPTLLEWFRAPVPASVNGRSLLALTDSWRPRPFPPRPAFAARGNGSFSLRTSEHRLTIQPPEDSQLCPLAERRVFSGDAALGEEVEIAAPPELLRELGERLRERLERESGRR